MTDAATAPPFAFEPAFVPTSAPSLRIFASVYFFSGFSTLVYQVVWQRALSIHFGVGPISTTVVVSVFMAGLGLGSQLGGIVSRRAPDRISAYLVVELALGLFGASSLWLSRIAGAFIATSSFGLGVAGLLGYPGHVLARHLLWQRMGTRCA